MALSGINVSDECLEAYNDLKLPKSISLRCIIYKISEDKKSIEIEQKIQKNTHSEDQRLEYEEIVKTLPEKEGRYIVWDLSVIAKSSGDAGTVEKDVIVFMAVCFDDCKVKVKMMFSTSKEALKKKLSGIRTTIEIKSPEELDYDTVIGAIKSK